MTDTTQRLLDQYIQRFENLPTFNVHHVASDGMSASVWMEVDPRDVAAELIYDELNVAAQLDLIAANIQKWTRLEAMANRVWQLRERQLRSWKAGYCVEIYEGAEGKKPPEWLVKEKYRVESTYGELSAEVERAEEAYNAVRGIVLAFRAKKDVLERFGRRST